MLKIVPWVLLAFLVLGVVGIIAVIVVPQQRGAGQPTPNTFVIVDYAVSAQLGIVADPNFEVLHVVPGGAAEQAGVKKGDVIKSINGKKLGNNRKSRKNIMKLKTSARKDTSISLVLARGADEIRLDIQPGYFPGSPGAPTVTPVPADAYYF